jgi:hypothetical protein
MHASGVNWLMEWIDIMKQSGDVQRKEIKVVAKKSSIRITKSTTALAKEIYCQAN